MPFPINYKKGLRNSEGFMHVPSSKKIPVVPEVILWIPVHQSIALNIRGNLWCLGIIIPTYYFKQSQQNL